MTKTNAKEPLDDTGGFRDRRSTNTIRVLEEAVELAKEKRLSQLPPDDSDESDESE